MQEFADKLNYFLEENVTEEEDYGDLLQETLRFSVFCAYLNCENIDEVDWVIRQVKQQSLKKRASLGLDDL